MKGSVYCNTCYQRAFFSEVSPFCCCNPDCPVPYDFALFADLVSAQQFYITQPSWMPKFYFHPSDETGEERLEHLWCVAWHDAPVSQFAPDTIADLIETDALLLMEVGLAHDIKAPVSVILPRRGRTPGERIEHLAAGVPLLCRPCCCEIRLCKHGTTDGNSLCLAFDQEIIDHCLSMTAPDRQVAHRTAFHLGQRLSAAAYICWAGFVDYVCPITIGGKTIAVIFTGQERLRGPGPDNLQGEEHLSRGIDRVVGTLPLGRDALLHLASDHPVLTAEQISEQGLDRVIDAAKRVLNIAYERYRRKRDEIEHYFRREAVYYLETEPETRDGIKCVDKALTRLRDFFGLQEVFFLVNDVHDLDTYYILANASSAHLADGEANFEVNFTADKLGIRDRISVFALTGKAKYAEVLSSIRRQLYLESSQEIWVGTCPLVGATNAFWMFIGPKPIIGLRPGTELTRLDQHFLTRFCVACRDVLKSALASSLVMRSVSHEIGTSLDRVFKREQMIARGGTSAENTRLLARRNICELNHYQALLDNLRSLFIRRTRDSYDFVRASVAELLQDICSAFEGDPAMEEYSIVLRPPACTGYQYLVMDRMLMRMALYNLVHNAVKYSFSQHYVTVKGHSIGAHQDRKYRVDIANYGVGILPQEIQDRLIFLPDYRGILSRDKERTGSGLGLAIADAVIRNHGGEIVVKSIPSRELTVRESEYKTVLEDPEMILGENGDLAYGWLNIFSVFLPYHQ